MMLSMHEKMLGRVAENAREKYFVCENYAFSIGWKQKS